jgi:hypothetical protein
VFGVNLVFAMRVEEGMIKSLASDSDQSGFAIKLWGSRFLPYKSCA